MCLEWQLLPPPPHPPHPLFFLYLSLYQPLSPALNLRAFNAQNFSNHRPFSPSLCASLDKYRTLLPFPNELWHTCAPPSHAWDYTVYKGQGWVAAGEWENKRSYPTQPRKQQTERKRKKGRQKSCVCYLLHLSLWKTPRRRINSLRLPLPSLYSPPLPYPALSAIHECDQLLCLSIGA